MRAIRAIAKTTSTELSSQPAALLLVLAGLVLTALIPLLHFHEFGEPGRIVRDGGLAYQFVIGTVLAVFSVSRSIRDELENGTALATLGKPVSRTAFLVGKYFGACSLLAFFWVATLASTMVSCRIPPRFATLADGGMGYVSDSGSQLLALLAPPAALAVAAALHYRRRARFCKAAMRLMAAFSLASLALATVFDSQWRLSPSFANVDFGVALASLPILLALLACCAFAAALSVRLPANVVAIAMAAIVVCGLSWSSLTARHHALSVLPVIDVQAFWISDALSRGGAVRPAALLRLFLYSAALSSFALCCGSLSMRGREIN